jgi:hypothetical protein
MKKIVTVICSIFLTTLLFSQDFQPFKLGDQLDLFRKKLNPDSIMISKIGNYIADVKVLTEREHEKYYYFLNIKCAISYFFIDDKLEFLRFFTVSSHQDLNSYLDDYHGIDDFLSKKYKKIETREFWDNDTYKNDPSKLALAVSLGHYSVSTTYKDSKTEIVHIMTQSFNKEQPICQTIEYSSERALKLQKEEPKAFLKDVMRKTK